MAMELNEAKRAQALIALVTLIKLLVIKRL
jgi:hypothetical protein